MDPPDFVPSNHPSLDIMSVDDVDVAPDETEEGDEVGESVQTPPLLTIGTVFSKLPKKKNGKEYRSLSH